MISSPTSVSSATRSPGSGSARRWTWLATSKKGSSSKAGVRPSGSATRWRKRGKRSTIRSSITAVTRSNSGTAASRTTALTTIGLVARSMCSQAASAAGIVWRLALIPGKG